MRRTERRGGVAIERLRALLGRPDEPLDGSGPPASFGGSPATLPGSAAPPSAPPLRAPPAAALRSSPRSPDDPVDDDVDGGVADGLEALDPMPQAAARGGLTGRLDPGLPGARALAAVGVLAALVAGGCLWLSRPRPQPVAGPVAASLAAPPVAGPSVSGPLTSAGAAQAATVVVHVAGKVRHPGVVTLPAGARVSDAIKAAGGPRPGARTGLLNLARKVVDGEQILVGMPAPAGAPAAGGTPGLPLDLNAATVEQFQQLPGVGPVLAQRIVDYRTRNGAFHSVAQLREVSGIGARRFNDLKDLVRV